MGIKCVLFRGRGPRARTHNEFRPGDRKVERENERQEIVEKADQRPADPPGRDTQTQPLTLPHSDSHFEHSWIYIYMPNATVLASRYRTQMKDKARLTVLMLSTHKNSILEQQI